MVSIEIAFDMRVDGWTVPVLLHAEPGKPFTARTPSPSGEREMFGRGPDPERAMQDLADRLRRWLQHSA